MDTQSQLILNFSTLLHSTSWTSLYAKKEKGKIIVKSLEKTRPPPKPNPMSSTLYFSPSPCLFSIKFFSPSRSFILLITKFDAAIDIVEEANQHRHEAFRSEEKMVVLLEILCETLAFQERVEPIVAVSVQIGDGDDDAVLGEE
ncbi:hypothetical protein JHK85_044442 [Glycine max]|nr:hypothetical protein JHK85_044442 [Glycine max]